MLWKCCWQQDAQWSRCAFNIDQQVCSTVLPQQLATSTTWRDVGVIANTRNRNDASAAALFDHLLRRQLRAEKSALQIDVVHALLS